MTNSNIKAQNSTELAQFFELSFDMLCIIDAKGCFKRLNPAFEKTLGWPLKELLNKPFLDCVHTDDLSPTRSAVEKLSQRIAATKFENRFRCEDGSYRWLAWNIQSGPNGAMYATARDMTHRKQAAGAYQESELRVRAVIDSALDAVVGMDANGEITEWNARAEEIFGWTHQEAVGQKMSQVIIPPPYREAHEQGLKHFLSTGEGPVLNQRIEITGLRRDGHEFPVELTVMPVKWGNTVSFNAFLRDITERKQMELQIQESLAHRSRQVATSTEVAQKIAAAPALDELFRQMVNLVKDRFGYYHAHVYTIKSENLVMQEGTGEPGHQMKVAGHKIALAAEKSLVARAARTGEAVLVPDVTLAPDWLPNPLLPDTKSELAMPIKLQEKVLGVLDVQSDTIGGLDDEDHLLLTGLCGQIAVAINNRLVEDKRHKAETELRKRSAQYAVLNEINLAVLAQSNPTAVYQMVSQSLVDHFDMSFAQIWLVDEFANELVLQISTGDYMELTGAYSRVPLDSDKKLARIARGRRPHLTNDLANDPPVDDRAWVKQSKMVAFAGYPLMAETKLLGILGMFSHQPIDTETQPLLQSLAVLVSTTTTTHRLLDQLTTHARELEAVAEVSVQAATVLEPTQLLQSVVDLAQERFGLYHAHIYLLDEAGQMLNLAAGAGDIGRRMVADGWQISFDREQSLVARAARLRQGVIVNNVRQAADWMPNPLLPNTHSELAVPIIAGDKLLGVLDVQADAVNCFTNEDVLTKTTLATQVAVALQNARSFEREEQAVKELNILTRRLTQEGWEEYYQARSGGEAGYVYDLQQVSSLGKMDDGGHGNADELKIEQSLFVRDEAIGQLTLSEPQRLSGDAADIVTVVAERLSAHIDNLRLAEQTQGALAETQILYEVSRELTAASSLQEALSNILTSLNRNGVSLGADNISLTTIEVDQDGRPDWAEMAAWWLVDNRDPPYPIGTRFPLKDVPTTKLWMSNPSNPLLLGNIQTDERLDETTRAQFLQGGTQASAMIPLSLAGRWVGIMNVSWTTPYEFSPLEERVYRGLIGQFAALVDNQRLFEQTQSALSEVRRLATIVENHPDFIGVGTLDGKALYVNPAGLQMMGLPADHDVTTMDAAKFYPPEDAERLLQEGVPAALEKGFWSAEANMLRVDGIAIPVEQTIGINYDTKGNPNSFSITMRNIIDRKQAEVERERLLVEVEAAYKQYVRQEWEQYLGEQHQGQWQVEYLQPRLSEGLAKPGSDGQGENGAHKTPTLDMPISLRGQDIGSFVLQDVDPTRKWTAEELALVETVTQQLALTVENLRLFDDTRQRATREQVTREIADQMRASSDIDTIIQAGVQGIAKVLGGSHTIVELNVESADG